MGMPHPTCLGLPHCCAPLPLYTFHAYLLALLALFILPHLHLNTFAICTCFTFATHALLGTVFRSATHYFGFFHIYFYICFSGGVVEQVVSWLSTDGSPCWHGLPGTVATPGLWDHTTRRRCVLTRLAPSFCGKKSLHAQEHTTIPFFSLFPTTPSGARLASTPYRHRHLRRTPALLPHSASVATTPTALPAPLKPLIPEIHYLSAGSCAMGSFWTHWRFELWLHFLNRIRGQNNAWVLSAGYPRRRGLRNSAGLQQHPHCAKRLSAAAPPELPISGLRRTVALSCIS